MDNKHLEAIPTDIIAQVQTKLNEIRTLLLPYATTPVRCMKCSTTT